MTNQTNAGSASSVAVTVGEGLVGDMDFVRGMDFVGDMDLSISLRKGVFRNCPYPLHTGFICQGLASWEGDSEVLGL